TSTPTTTVESAPRLSATAKGKQPLRAATPVEPTDAQRTEAEQLKIRLVKAAMRLEKVKVKVMTKKLEKRKMDILIRFLEHLVKRKAMMRRSRI
nr:hypothetical protein [Tanacetum cinerariifolium]